LRAAESGPWQVKQFSERMGRMWVLNSGFAGAAARAAEGATKKELNINRQGAKKTFMASLQN
jgi:hypothetical protein